MFVRMEMAPALKTVVHGLIVGMALMLLHGTLMSLTMAMYVQMMPFILEMMMDDTIKHLVSELLVYLDRLSLFLLILANLQFSTAAGR